MKPFPLLFLWLFASVNLHAQDLHWKWAKSGGGVGADYGAAVGTDDDGNVYVVGLYHRDPNFSGNTIQNTSSYMLTKHDPAGNFVFAHKLNVDTSWTPFVRFDGKGNVYLAGMPNNTSIEGTTYAMGNGGLLIAKYDNSGNHLWTTQDAKNAGEIDNSLTVDAQGNLYVNVENQGYIIYGSDTIRTTTTANGFGSSTAKYGPDGQREWAKQTGSAKQGVFSIGITTDPYRNIYVTGMYRDTLFIEGYTFPPLDSNNNNAFLVKYDSTGRCIWAKRYGSYIWGPSVLVSDREGNIFIQGTGILSFDTTHLLRTPHSGDLALLKCDSAGNLLWAKLTAGEDYFGTAPESPSQPVIDDNGNIFLTSVYGNWSALKDTATFDAFTLYTNKQSNHYFVKLDRNGHTVWAYNLDSAARIGSMALCRNQSGDIFMAGYFTGNVSLRNKALTGHGGSDMFVAMVDPNPEGVEQVVANADGVLVYPNPTNGDLSIYFTGIAFPEVSVRDQLGRIAYRQKINGSNGTLHVSPLASGQYYLHLTAKDGNTITKKFIVQH